MKIVVLDSLNNMWNIVRPQKGRFEILPFGNRTVGWVFKPEQPHIENYVGYRDGFVSEEDAIQDLTKFVLSKVQPT